MHDLHVKPLVHYRRNPELRIVVGMPALIYPIDHTSDLVSNGGVPAITSRVIRKREDGVFETQNTIYVPEGYEL